jgi:hypothetical protein
MESYSKINVQKELAITGILKEIIKQIEDDMTESYQNKISISVTELPEFIEIPFTEEEDSRLIVIYRLLKELEKKKLSFKLANPGYFCVKCQQQSKTYICSICKHTTKIKKNIHQSIIVKLKNYTEKNEKKKMLQYIKSKSITF